MKIKWQKPARKGLIHNAAYVRREFGKKARQNFDDEVERTMKLLAAAPQIGQLEPLLADRTYSYRSLIIRTYNKLVYRIDGDTIQIVAFWDTRREPEAQVKDLK